MMNKKLMALLMAISTVTAVSAHYYEECYTDEDGYEHCEKRHGRYRDRECIDGECEGRWHRTGRPVRDTVRNTGEAAHDVVHYGTLGIVP